MCEIINRLMQLDLIGWPVELKLTYFNYIAFQNRNMIKLHYSTYF